MLVMSEFLTKLSKALGKDEGGYSEEHAKFFAEHQGEIVLIGGMLGRLDKLNDRTSGWYPGSRYPFMITVVHDERTGEHNALGKRFEYAPGCFHLIPKGKYEIPEDVEKLQHLGRFIELLHGSKDQAMYDYIKVDYDLVYFDCHMALLRHCANLILEHGAITVQELLLQQLKTPIAMPGIQITNSPIEKMTMLVMLMQAGVEFTVAQQICKDQLA